VDVATLPLIIGVSGHRDLHVEAEPQLESALRSTIEQLRARCPHSSLVLLSPLAEGADRLAARVALAAGVRLIVPLPMPLELYESDYATEASRAEFKELFGRADARIDLPLLPGVTPQCVRLPGPLRDHEYAKVGAFIATYSHVFVAFWDGEDGPIGGTGQIVQFRLTGAPSRYVPRHSALSPPTGRPVEHILTPRVSNPALKAAFSTSTLLPEDRDPASIARLLKRMDLFNRDARDLEDTLRAGVATSKSYLLGCDVASVEQVTRTLPTPCVPVLQQYAEADALSIHFGTRTLRASKQVFAGVCITAVLLNLHTSYYEYLPLPDDPGAPLLERVLETPWALLGFFAMFAFSALVLHRRATKHELQHKHQDYRALAEALRVQFFWLAAGVRDPVVHRYLRRHRSDLEWIRSALLSSGLLMHVRTSEGRPDAMAWPEWVPFLRDRWIDDQRRYYGKRAGREQHTLDREERLGGWLLRGSVVTAGLFAVVLSAAIVYPSAPLRALRHLTEIPFVFGSFEFLIVVLALVGGLILAYGEQMARAEHVRQSTRMSELFWAGEQELAERLRAGDEEAAREVVSELGTWALDEAADWLILHRERPLELPSMG